MRAVVLVGGFGTRLRPLTHTIPKPMLPVGHLPIIERVVANLGRGGVTEVTLALGFKPEPFIDAFPGGACAGVQLRYAVEPEPLDTAGAIRFAADASGIDDTFVVANGDVLTDLDVAELVRFHRERGAEATMHLIAVDDPSSFGVVAMDEDGRVRRFVEKPAPGTSSGNLINAGTYILEPSVLARIPLGARSSIERVTFPAVASDGGLYAKATEDYWLDVGRPELYLSANLDLLAGRRRYDTATGIHPGAAVHPDAVIVDSTVAAGARIDSGASVRESVILSGAVIGQQAEVVASVILGTVGAGATVTGCVLGSEGVVAAGERVAGERRPDPDAG
ncbi:MAG: putative mannose-phosphate guanylyltransferase [Ilumatobacteraceae bacterium]|nr:putative mannose-phosphate guanylyltransferase [Ilumatobacteraceae bacterium]